MRGAAQDQRLPDGVGEAAVWLRRLWEFRPRCSEGIPPPFSFGGIEKKTATAGPREKALKQQGGPVFRVLPVVSTEVVRIGMPNGESRLSLRLTQVIEGQCVPIKSAVLTGVVNEFALLLFFCSALPAKAAQPLCAVTASAAGTVKVRQQVPLCDVQDLAQAGQLIVGYNAAVMLNFAQHLLIHINI